MSGTVGVDRCEALDHKLVYVTGDEVADRAHLLQCLAGRVGNIPRLDRRRYIGAGVSAAHRDRPIGLKLHLTGQLLGLASGEVEADLAARKPKKLTVEMQLH